MLMTFTEVAPEDENEFNDWYNVNISMSVSQCRVFIAPDAISQQMRMPG